MLILIDAGHGMANKQPGVYDSGATGPGGAEEATYALSYALRLREEVLALGAQVGMTRTDAVEPCSLLYRIRTYNRLAPDAMCSIHFNATTNKGVGDGRLKGFEVLWRTRGILPEDGQDSLSLAAVVGEALAAAGRVHLNPYTLYRPDLAVISKPNSVLVELGFIDDPDDLAQIQDEGWMSGTCKVLAGALVAFAKMTAEERARVLTTPV